MKITYKHLFFAWLPLGVMWIVMAAEQPAVTGVISRLPDAVNQLAAFGYSFALALLIEGPVVQMLSAGTAVSGTEESYKKILKIMNILAIITLIVHLFFCIPSIFEGVAVHIMHLPANLVHPAWTCFMFMIPWTPCIGYRRLWQGVLIKHEKSALAPVVMYVRLSAAFLFLWLGLLFKPLKGAALGGAIMGMVAIVGMLMAYLLVRPILRDLKNNSKKQDTKELESETATAQMTMREMVVFYIPLAITSMVSLGVRPILNFGIPRGLFPIESLAIWPIMLSYVLLYTAISQSLQEIVIAEMNAENYKTLQRFVTVVAFVISGLYAITWFVKPFRNFWFTLFFNFPQELYPFLPISIAILAPLAFLAAKISWFRGVFIANHKTKIITAGIVVNLSTLLTFIIVLPLTTKLAGVYIGAIAYISSFSTEFCFLWWKSQQK
jgi:hypothetical protein